VCAAIGVLVNKFLNFAGRFLLEGCNTPANSSEMGTGFTGAHTFLIMGGVL